jgi:hypothetical protein
MPGIQGDYFAARFQDGGGQDSIVDVSSVARIPFAFKFPGHVDDLLIYRCGLKLR